MNTLDELGRDFAGLRKEKGLSQQTVASAAGVSVGTVNRFENGQLTELGVRKLMELLSLVGAELTISARRRHTLDDLREERQAARAPVPGNKRGPRP